MLTIRFFSLLTLLYNNVDGSDFALLTSLKNQLIDLLHASSDVDLSLLARYCKTVLGIRFNVTDRLSVIKQLQEDIALFRRVSRVPDALGVDVKALLSSPCIMPGSKLFHALYRLILKSINV